MNNQNSQPFMKETAAGSLIQSNTPYDGATTETTSFNTAPFFVGRAETVDIRVICTSTGSPVGTVKIQSSIDRSKSPLGDRVPDANVSHWIDVPMRDATGASVSAQALSGASTLDFIDPKVCCRWYRVVYTRTSGTIAPTIMCQFKGAA